ncbi:MAG: peptidoglycan DD-metalloendopeptidase family protein [Candidatus Giovannonibacteria bacterium]|nr:MAG: peptidoglycan DD-metalloendopeptidase family protein [Candidatus Giovannonibacteria bacterium]
MKPKFKIIIMAALLALVLYSLSFAAESDDLKSQIDQKNTEIQQLETEIKQYQEGIEEAESTADTLKGEIKRLDNEIKKLNAQISLTQTRISKKELEIKELGKNITDTSASIKNRQAALAKILEGLNARESEGTLTALLKYDTMSDFFDELERIKSLNESIRENYEELKMLKLNLEDRKQKAEAARRDLKNLQNELLAHREIQKDARAEKNNLLAATKNQEALYQKLLRDREKRRAEIYEEIKQIENELKKQIDFGSLPTFGSGILLNPIDGGVITQEFGRTSFSRYTDVYGNGFHNGIDFRAAVGTPIRAADGGVVKATGNTDYICPRGSYGKWVLIDHPNKLATLYAHLSLVRVGPRQEVGKGDIIGYSGNSGYTTGPHLHFTVYDARTVQLRKSRVCGVLPYGGYLDPANYL